MKQQIGSHPSTWVDGTPLPTSEPMRYPARDELLERLKNDILCNPPMPASRWRRAVAGLIDLTLLALVGKGIAAFLVAGASPIGPPVDSLELGAFVITSVLAAGYMVGCWLLWGATLGMALLHIGVGDERFGGPLSGRQAWRRFVVLYLLGGLAFLVMLVSRDPWGRTWYDRAGGTVVLAE
jgi:uncharacterized RDD family membrane protein YckC